MVLVLELGLVLVMLEDGRDPKGLSVSKILALLGFASYC